MLCSKSQNTNSNKDEDHCSKAFKSNPLTIENAVYPNAVSSNYKNIIVKLMAAINNFIVD